MTDQATFGIAITASDKTAKGKKSAEKNLGQIPKNLGALNRRAAEQGDRAVARSGRNILRTLGSVEQASARAFGNRSLTSGFTSRLGAIREAASAAGSGIGEASAAGGVLEGTLGALGVAAGATVGILAAVAYGAFKLVDGWAKGASAIGHTAEILGVATKAYQEFIAAGERAGLDKGTAGAAIGGLNQSLNDARYGRNNDVLALIGRLGLKLKTKEDGTVDTEAMLPQIADAIAKQNSSGRRTAARILGIPEAALPAFTQGGASLKADMVDADTHAGVLTDADIEKGKRIARKGVIAGQLGERGMMLAGGAAAGTVEKGYDAVIDGGRYLVDGANSFAGTVNHDFKPAAQANLRAADKMERAAGQIERASGGGRIALARETVAAAQAAERKYGVPASITLGQFGLESSFGKHMPKGSNNPFGIKARAGQPYVVARTREETRDGRSYYVEARFRKFASLAEAFDEHAKLLATGKPYARARAATTVSDYADALQGTYATDTRYAKKLKSVIGQGHFTDYDNARDAAPIPVKVEIDMRGAPAGTKAKVTAGHGRAPAVSHAFQPVHGG